MASQTAIRASVARWSRMAGQTQIIGRANQARVAARTGAASNARGACIDRASRPRDTGAGDILGVDEVDYFLEDSRDAVVIIGVLRARIGVRSDRKPENGVASISHVSPLLA